MDNVNFLDFVEFISLQRTLYKTVDLLSMALYNKSQEVRKVCQKNKGNKKLCIATRKQNGGLNDRRI